MIETSGACYSGFDYSLRARNEPRGERVQDRNARGGGSQIFIEGVSHLYHPPSGRPVHILLTKSDKLTRGPAAATLMELRRELPQWGPNVTAQLFSSLKKVGIEETERVVGNWLEQLIPDADANLPE